MQDSRFYLKSVDVEAEACQALCLLLSNSPVLGNEQHFRFKFKHVIFTNIVLSMDSEL